MPSFPRPRIAALAGLCFVCPWSSGCNDAALTRATPADAHVALDAGLPPPIDIPNPVRVETTAPDTIRVGERLEVDCTIFDAEGERYSDIGRIPELRFAPSGSIEDARPVVAGSLEVSCAFPDLMLIDDSPAEVRVLPGSVAELLTTVDRASLEAGESLDVGCEAFDAFGNRVEDFAPTVSVEPTVEGNETSDRRVVFTKAGLYDVSCTLDGAETQPERVEVTPTRPAALAIARVPDQMVYGIGQVLEIASVVTDRYDNVIEDADVRVTSSPAGGQLGRPRLRYDADGRYRVVARVAPPTESGEPLVRQTTVVVNGDGPQIRCEGPGDGAMIRAAAGSTVIFRGQVSDASGVADVFVNGEAVSVGQSGEFSRPVQVGYGVHFVDVVARDSFGTESTRTCAFLAARRYASPEDISRDSLTLRLDQAAVDDRDPRDGLDSVNDLLVTALNSDDLVRELDRQLRGNRVLKPSECDVRVLVCVFRSEILYDGRPGNPGIRVLGARQSRLTLVNGGLRTALSIGRLGVRLNVNGTFDRTGWVDFEDIQVDVTFNVDLHSGAPRVRVRPGSVRVDIGRVRADFSGFSGTVVDIVLRLAQGRVRRLVEDTLKDFVRDSFDEILEGVLGGLDVSSLGTEVSVPRLDGRGEFELDVALGLSTLGITQDRLLIGVGTRFTGPVNIGTPTLGVARPPGLIRRDPDTSGRSAGAAVHGFVLNQVLHALWRAGFLEGAINTGALSGDMPEGLWVELSGALPPVAQVESTEAGDRVRVDIGALTLNLVYPGLFEEPITVTLGARAVTRVQLAGEDLSFDRITIEELVFSAADVSLDAASRDALEGFLRMLIQNLVDDLLNDGLPSLPIPSFEIPSSLTRFGLPGGTSLGLVGPSLDTSPPHFILRSDFGVRR